MQRAITFCPTKSSSVSKSDARFADTKRAPFSATNAISLTLPWNELSDLVPAVKVSIWKNIVRSRKKIDNYSAQRMRSTSTKKFVSIQKFQPTMSFKKIQKTTH